MSDFREPPAGAPAPPQVACPVCEMTRKHQSKCPYEGLSMAAAWEQYRQDGGTENR